MINDPIIEEIHAQREKVAKEYQYDVSKYFADLQARERIAERKQQTVTCDIAGDNSSKNAVESPQ